MVSKKVNLIDIFISIHFLKFPYDKFLLKLTTIVRGIIYVSWIVAASSFPFLCSYRTLGQTIEQLRNCHAAQGVSSSFGVCVSCVCCFIRVHRHWCAKSCSQINSKTNSTRHKTEKRRSSQPRAHFSLVTKVGELEWKTCWGTEKKEALCIACVKAAAFLSRVWALGAYFLIASEKLQPHQRETKRIKNEWLRKEWGATFREIKPVQLEGDKKVSA